MENFISRIELDRINTIEPKKIHWNLTPPLLYEEIVKRSEAMIADKGPIVIYTGKSTGRSPMYAKLPVRIRFGGIKIINPLIRRNMKF
jgi:ATP-dependent phosphoenolpyruvate carboxykinase